MFKIFNLKGSFLFQNCYKYFKEKRNRVKLKLSLKHGTKKGKKGFLQKNSCS